MGRVTVYERRGHVVVGRVNGECQPAATYYAKVTRTAAKDSDRGRWPVELLVLREPALGGGSPTVTSKSARTQSSSRRFAAMRTHTRGCVAK